MPAAAVRRWDFDWCVWVGLVMGLCCCWRCEGDIFGFGGGVVRVRVVGGWLVGAWRSVVGCAEVGGVVCVVLGIAAG